MTREGSPNSLIESFWGSPVSIFAFELPKHLRGLSFKDICFEDCCDDLKVIDLNDVMLFILF